MDDIFNNLAIKWNETLLGDAYMARWKRTGAGWGRGSGEEVVESWILSLSVLSSSINRQINIARVGIRQSREMGSAVKIAWFRKSDTISQNYDRNIRMRERAREIVCRCFRIVTNQTWNCHSKRKNNGRFIYVYLLYFWNKKIAIIKILQLSHTHNIPK